VAGVLTGTGISFHRTDHPEGTMSANSFGARDRLKVGEAAYDVYRLDRVDGSAGLPYSLKVLLENVLRNEDGHLVTAEQVSALSAWDPAAESGTEIQFTPAVSQRCVALSPCPVAVVHGQPPDDNTDGQEGPG
jgi:aconitate hydratase A / 2-methylisocitrate dehydratase